MTEYVFSYNVVSGTIIADECYNIIIRVHGTRFTKVKDDLIVHIINLIVFSL